MSPVDAVAVVALAGWLLQAPPVGPGEQARDRWQKVPEVLQALGLKPGNWVADVGAGLGYFTVRMAPVVEPGGRVLAVNVRPEAAERLRRRAKEAGLTNVDSILGK